MTRLLITIKTLSPLYAGASKPYGSFLETYREIFGALLRGAVAQKTLPDCIVPELKNNHEACEVKDICPFYYLTKDVVFPTCAVAEGGRPTQPPLRTMVTCKVAPGFGSESKPREPKHGVLDTLLHHLAFNELRRLGHSPSKLPPMRCKVCNEPLEPYMKRYVYERKGRYHVAPPVATRRMTHVGINRRRETAEQGLLYSVQSVAEGIQFVGYMTVPESWDDNRVAEFKRLLGGITHLGGEQTYGLGHVEIVVKELEDDSEDVPTRINELNAKLREVWSEYASTAGDAPTVPEGDYLTIDLFTPALLTTPDGTPTVQLTSEMLKVRAAELGCGNLPDLEAVVYMDAAGNERPLILTAPLIVTGWSEAWGLPKPTALAAGAGSVFVFRTQDASTWYEAFARIEAHGIGTRREEGFGAVRVCDPFHLEVMPV